MSHLYRLLYAAGMTAVLLGIFILVTGILAPKFMNAFFAEPYWIAAFVLSYLVASVVSRHIQIA